MITNINSHPEPAKVLLKYPMLVGFLLCIPVANFLIGNVGTVCVPNGPCLVPVGFGLSAPSGVIVIGLALVLRDGVHEAFGVKWAITAVLIGSALSGLIAPPSLVLASAAAFLLSEFADLSVYAPLRKKSLALAVLASGMAGSIVDSAIFLWIAFSSFDYLQGQVVGKIWASLAAFFLLASLQQYRKMKVHV